MRGVNIGTPCSLLASQQAALGLAAFGPLRFLFVSHRDHGDFSRAVDAQGKPRAHACGHVQAAGALLEQSNTMSVRESEVGVGPVFHGDLPAMRVPGERERNTQFRRTHERLGIVRQQQIDRGIARGIDVPGACDCGLGPVNASDGKPLAVLTYLEHFISQHLDAGFTCQLAQRLCAMQFIVIAQHQRRSQRRIDPRHRIQQRPGVIVMKVNHIARARDQIRLLLAQQLDHIQRTLQRKQRAQVKVAHVADAQTVKRLGPAWAGDGQLSDNDVLRQMTSLNSPAADLVGPNCKEKMADLGPLILSISLRSWKDGIAHDRHHRMRRTTT